MKKQLIKYIPLLTLPLSNAVFAEDAASTVSASTVGSVLTLDSMSVTANVAEAKLGGIDVKTLPMASTVVNQDEIKRLKYVTPDELLDRIPGESLSRNLRIPAGGKSYTIPLIDGAALGSPLSGSTQAFSDTVNSQDIERIEIFKGPTSALYPNNAFGGTINVVSKGTNQLPEQKTRLWTEAGNYDRYRGGVSTQGDIEGVGYMLDFSSWNLSAYRDQALIGGIEHEVGEERQQASGKLIFHPDDVSSLVVRGSYLNVHSTSPGTLTQTEFDSDNSVRGVNSGFFTNEESYLGSAIYKRDITDVDHLEANFNFKYLDEDGDSRFGGVSEDIDIDVNGKASLKHDFDFLNANIIIGTDIYQGSNDDYNPDNNDYDYSTTDIYAGFAQIQFSPIENLQITAGVRHESIELNHMDLNAAGTVTSDSSIKFKATLPKVGISYDFLDDHRIWFAYGEGFLVPTTGQLFTGRGNNSALQPEEAEHFEVGLRGRLPILDRDLTYDTSYYYQDIKNYVVSTDINGFNDRNENAGKVNIQGVETVIEYQPYDFIRFGITHTFSSNTFKEYIDNKGADLSGEELRSSPEHHINGRVAVMPMEGLAIELGVDSQSSYSTVDNSSFDTKGRFERDERINLRLTYDKGPYELWFHALNIGDVKEDRVSYSTPRNGDPRNGERSIRTVDGLQLYGGIAYNF